LTNLKDRVIYKALNINCVYKIKYFKELKLPKNNIAENLNNISEVLINIVIKVGDYKLNYNTVQLINNDDFIVNNNIRLTIKILRKNAL